MQQNPVCPYCNKLSELVKGDVIYPHRRDLFWKYFYICHPCDAYVGCHPHSTKSLGRLANKELRKLKSEAHSLFDPVWKSGLMTRKSAYKELANRMQIDVNLCHIGMFNEEQCRQVIALFPTN